MPADPPGADDGDTHGPTPGRPQVRPGALEGLEAGADAVPRDALQVLHEPAPGIVGDHVEGHGVDVHPVEHPDPRGAGGEVEHGHEDGPGPEELVAALGCAQDDDDIPAVRARLVDDVGRAGRRVVLVAVPHPGADTALDGDLRPARRQPADDVGQEVPPLGRLLVHAWEPDAERSRERRHARSSGGTPARS